jgi:hypothetical protein
MRPPVLSSDWLTATRRSNLQWVHCLHFAASLHCSMLATSVCFCSHDARSLFCFFCLQSSGTICHTRLRRTNCVIHCREKVSQLCQQDCLGYYVMFRPWLRFGFVVRLFFFIQREIYDFVKLDGPFSLLYLLLPPLRTESMLMLNVLRSPTDALIY